MNDLGNEDRSIRVFVSSTFRDMHAERDVLQRFVFPELRHLCEAHDFSLFEIDLRWGITSEDAAEGHVLELCLSEIDRSRPYFVVILGDRYGWIDERAADVLPRIAPHLAQWADRSVTELEIRHGLLNTPPNCLPPQALVYFRHGVTPDEGAEAYSSRVRLAALKADLSREDRQIRAYADPQQLREFLIQDFRNLLARRFDDIPSEERTDRGKRLTTSFARRRSASHVSSPAFEVLLDRTLTRSRGDRIVVLGERGTGKTSHLANWWMQHRTRSLPSSGKARPGLGARLTRWFGMLPASPDLVVVADFAGAQTNRDLLEPVRRVTHELSASLGHVGDEPVSRWELAARLARSIEHVAARSPLVIVMDGLDDIASGLNMADLSWLPDHNIPGATLVLSLSSPELAAELEAKGWRIVRIPPLATAERAQIAEHYLRPFGRRFDRKELKLVTEPQGTGNALFLTTLVEEIRQFGVFEKLEDCIRGYAKAETADELFELVLARLESSYAELGTGTVGRVIGLLAVSRAGLAESEIIALTRTSECPSGLTPRAWSVLRQAVNGLLVERGGLFAIEHASLRAAVERRYLATNDAVHALRRSVVALFSASPVGPRALDEVPWQLSLMEDWDGLAQWLAKPSHLAALTRREPMEPRLYWTELQNRAAWRAGAVYAPIIETTSEEELTALVDLLAQLGETTLARAASDRLTSRLSSARDPTSFAGHLIRHAGLLAGEGDSEGSLRLLQDAFSLIESHGLAGLRIACQTATSNALNDLGRHQEVLALSEAAQTEAGRSLQIGRLSALLGAKAKALHGLGRDREAHAVLSEQLTLAGRTGDPEILRLATANLAVLERQMGNTAAAFRLHAKEQEICRRLGDKRGLHESLGNEALACMDRGDCDRALALLDEKQRLADAIEDKVGWLIAEGYKGLAFKAAGQPAIGLKVAREAFDTANRHALTSAKRELVAVIKTFAPRAS